MIRARLIALFGEGDNFTLAVAERMKEIMIEEARLGRKEEYMSLTGLAHLFHRAEGKLTNKMRSVLTAREQLDHHDQALIESVSSVCF